MSGCPPSSAPARVGIAIVRLAVLLTLMVSCSAPERAGEPPDSPTPAATGSSDVPFLERADAAGLRFVHFNGMSGRMYMAEITGSGVALLDYDNDDDLDVYVVQGALLGPGATMADALFPPADPPPPRDRLFRNDTAPGGELRFTDVTDGSGIAAFGYGMGVATGDVDNDGWVDLYVTNLGPNELWRNNGDGTFSEVAAARGVDDPRWGVSAVFFDADRDGWLDLFVGNYLDEDFSDRRPICKDFTGAQDYCGPGSFRPQADSLLHNRGDGTFEDVTKRAGLRGGFGGALGVVAADFDDDGRLDLYVANDGLPNNLWMQQSDGTFRDEALLAGCSVSAQGKAEASMGVDAADYDGDGDIDLFMTHLTGETNTLYRNDGRGVFDDGTTEAALGLPSRSYTSFGTAWLDFDNDGWLDILAVSGAVKRIEALARARDPFPLHQPNQLFRNLGGGRFEDLTASAGEALALSEVSRGAAFGDLDGDGDTDVVINNNNGPARLLVNQQGSSRRWLGLRLLTADGRRDALDARVELTLRDGRRLSRRCRAAASFASANDPRVLFGLGDDGEPSALSVRWPDGKVEEITPLPPLGRYTAIRQGAAATGP